MCVFVCVVLCGVVVFHFRFTLSRGREWEIIGKAQKSRLN